MKAGLVHPLLILCILAVVGGLALRLVAGPLCLVGRSVSGCERCCQPESPSETEGRVPACSLFCCTGLPGYPEIPIPRAVDAIIILPVLQDQSVDLALIPPPPKFWSSISCLSGNLL